MNSPEQVSEIASISATALGDEAAAVRQSLSHLEHLSAIEPAILNQATQWVEAIRTRGRGHGIEAFLQTYGLDTKEGVALMCLAEALLRIPDSATIDRLIHSTFDAKQWRSPITGEEPWLINASSWGLWLTGKVVNEAPAGILGTLQGLAGKLGEPLIRQALKQAMKLIGSQFVLAENMREGIAAAKGWQKQGYRFSYDILGEGARSEAQALAYIASYSEAISLLGKQPAAKSLFGNASLSVKLSALHPRYQLSQKERVFRELLPRLKAILLLAKENNLAVAIDAEEANRFDLSLMVFEKLLVDPDLAGWNGIGFVLQAYQKRALHTVGYLRELAERTGRIIPVRLVKGAYWDSEIKHAQMMGLPAFPVFTRKEHTDVSYLACANALLKENQYFYPQFATHNARSIASIVALAAQHNVTPDKFEFQRLHGMGEALHAQIMGKYASRIYAPIGAHKDLLAYLIRRLLENGANTSFVNLLMDEEVPLTMLLADPIVAAKQPKPLSIPVPADLYGDRRNSPGVDLGYLFLREPLERMLQHAPPLAATLPTSSVQQLQQACAAAKQAFPAWSQQPVEERAVLLEAIAEMYERERDSLLILLVQEAKKTLPDAIGEWREAIDYCRYYAVQARKLQPEILQGPTGESNQLSLHARGVFGCISPWNFPLAIFTGQLAAALGAGNSVVAKPAEQTPRIAARAVKLMHAAGIPQGVLQLVIGEGSAGQQIVEAPEIAGIVFTGSMAVAQQINRSLANRPGPILPLIAETGGQNCMLVDSSALLEQAVDDIIASAFGSAGQRCSALRMLYVQEDIAEDLLQLLSGAMQELKLGDPMEISTDIGPVIDQQARANLEEHAAALAQQKLSITILKANDSEGNFVTPRVFEIKDGTQLTEEHFGPILHVIRFKASEMKRVADEINATGYGLTFGIHSRIEENIRFFMERIHAGNRYVNRSMIGAVVGVQPFGGEGLSGTGPKAGGPHYLLRFVTERTTTINSAAIGGNIALMTEK